MGLNPKVSTLRQLLPLARHELIVISDSDVRVKPDLLKRLAAALQQPGVGLATCLYRSGPVRTNGAALEALTLSADFIPSVAMAHYVEGIHFALGVVMAVPRHIIEHIGGLAAIADSLADDYQLGYRVSQAGWQVLLLPYVVETLTGRQTVAGYLAHQLRWTRTYRVCRPRGYFAYGITFALPWGLLAWLAGGLAPWGGRLAVICLLPRRGGCHGRTRLFAGPPALALFYAAAAQGYPLLRPLDGEFLRQHGEMERQKYRVAPDGRLEELPKE